MAKIPSTLGDPNIPQDRSQRQSYKPAYAPNTYADASIRAAQAPASPLTDLGAVVGGVAKDMQQRQDTFELSAAKSQWLRDNIDAENAFNNDQDYSTFGQRYQKTASENINNAAALIHDPMQKQQFLDSIRVDAAQSAQKISQLADAKRKDYKTGWIIDAGQKNIDAALATKDQAVQKQLLQANSDMIDSAVHTGDMDYTHAVELKQKQAESYGETWLKLHPADVQTNILSGTGTVPLADAIKPIGKDADTLTKIAMLESNGNHTAVNPANPDAVGLYQFSSATAAQYGLKDRTNVIESTKAAQALLNDNRKEMTKTLGREPTPAELALANQQGANGSASLIQHPDQNAIFTLNQAGVNPDRAKASILQNGGTADMTSAQFVKMHQDRFDAVPVDKTNDITIYPKTGTPVDFIPIAKRIELHDGAIADQAAEIRAKNQLLEEQNKQVKNDLLAKIVKDPTSVTSSEILSSSLNPDDKKIYLDMVKSGLKDGDYSLYMEKYQAVLRGEITNAADLVPFLNMPNGGGLSGEQATSLISIMAKDDNSAEDNRLKAEFFKSMKSIVVPEAGIQEYETKWQETFPSLVRAFEDGHKKKISVLDMITPSNKEFIGKGVVSPENITQNGIDKLNKPAALTEEETLKQKVRSETDPVKRAALLKEAEDKGFIHKQRVQTPISGE